MGCDSWNCWKVECPKWLECRKLEGGRVEESENWKLEWLASRKWNGGLLEWWHIGRSKVEMEECRKGQNVGMGGKVWNVRMVECWKWVECWNVGRSASPTVGQSESQTVGPSEVGKGTVGKSDGRTVSRSERRKVGSRTVGQSESQTVKKSESRKVGKWTVGQFAFKKSDWQDSQNVWMVRWLRSRQWEKTVGSGRLNGWKGQIVGKAERSEWSDSRTSDNRQSDWR